MTQRYQVARVVYAFFASKLAPTRGEGSVSDPRIGQPTPQAENDKAHGNRHQQMTAGLCKRCAADGGGEEHDAISC